MCFQLSTTERGSDQRRLPPEAAAVQSEDVGRQMSQLLHLQEPNSFGFRDVQGLGKLQDLNGWKHVGRQVGT